MEDYQFVLCKIVPIYLLYCCIFVLAGWFSWLVVLEQLDRTQTKQTGLDDSWNLRKISYDCSQSLLLHLRACS